jgi:hypothetical protein
MACIPPDVLSCCVGGCPYGTSNFYDRGCSKASCLDYRAACAALTLFV